MTRSPQPFLEDAKGERTLRPPSLAIGPSWGATVRNGAAVRPSLSQSRDSVPDRLFTWVVLDRRHFSENAATWDAHDRMHANPINHSPRRPQGALSRILPDRLGNWAGAGLAIKISARGHKREARA